VFSGIVKSKGRVLDQAARGGDRQVRIGAAENVLERLEIGGSIAVNGVCLTVVARAPDSFTADVSQETLSVTTLGTHGPGSEVNLELPLRVGDPVDGHWVTGHVDGVGRVTAVEPAARSLKVTIELPRELRRYAAPKGAIAVDGVSLTVNEVYGERFDVNIIPHTRELTVISGYRPGTPVNIEVDIIARYLERGHAYTSDH
jgi:riboflavin synthase